MPERYLRPVEESYVTDGEAGRDQLAMGANLLHEYGIVKERLTDCYICHR